MISTAILANFDVIRESRQMALKAKSELAVRLLAEHCPLGVAHIPQGGLSLWIDLPDDSAEAIAQRASQAGVAIATGAAASVTTSGSSLFVSASTDLRLSSSKEFAVWVWRGVATSRRRRSRGNWCMGTKELHQVWGGQIAEMSQPWSQSAPAIWSMSACAAVSTDSTTTP
ncbi:MAG: hypothetical protein R2706_10875 [Acidimicrobiales bacterium]